jgi:cation diffusion facilitator family transporter
MLFHPAAAPESIEIGLMVMIVTIAIDILVSRYLSKISKEHGSAALEADAAHFTTDILGAVAVIIGLAFVLVGFPIFDSIAAIAVAVIMLWISYGLGRKSMNVLMDASPSYEVMERIGRIVSNTPGVERYHKLKARHAGNKMLVEMHIHVANGTSVERAHEIAHDVKKRLMKEIPYIKDVTIHIEPNSPHF